MKRRMLVIVNPYATTVSDRLRGLAVRALESRFEVEISDTEAPGHATTIARDRAGDFDLIVAFGGDGTVNEVANGLAHSQTPMTALPGGSTSVFARLLGYPNNVPDAIERLLLVADHFEPRPIDLGKVDDRYFTFTSGFGFDASVVAKIDSRPRLKARFGHAYAAYAGFSTAAGKYAFGPPQIRVEVDGESFDDGVTVMVQNAEIYSYFRNTPLRVARGADLASGTLAGAVLTSSRATVVPGISRRLLSAKAEVSDHRSVATFENAEDIVLSADRLTPLHVDGDHVGDFMAVRYSIAPAALLVVG